MIENAAILFASGVLKFAPDLALRPEIEAELASYTTMATAEGNQIITHSRSTAAHGDLGIALIVAMSASQYLRARHITRQTQLRGMWRSQ